MTDSQPLEIPESAKEPHPEAAEEPGARRIVFWVALAVALGVRIFFWAYTERVWEDALITLRHAENAARGLGLTHHPAQGPPVHGFTSPISVLIPLAGELIRPGSGLMLLRVFSLIAAAVTIRLGYRIAIHPAVALSTPATAFFLGYLAIEHHQVMFGMAGMETQCIIAITLFGLLMGLRESLPGMGLACGLALWGRPDGVVLILAILTALLLRGRWKWALASVGIGLAVIAPWLLFCELYYGSVVPHTIVAKSAAYTPAIEAGTPGERARLWISALAGRADNLRLWFSPSFGGMGGGTINFMRGARPLQAVFVLFAVLGSFRLVRRGPAIIIPTYAWGFFAYLVLMVPVVGGWYLPPWLATVAMLFAAGCDGVRGPSRLQTRAAQALPLAFLVAYATATTRTIPAERQLQTVIEDPVRLRAGRWLGRHVDRRDWIGCECLGYFGYYSGRPILDFPGLACPRSVAALRAMPEDERSLSALIAAERPEWLALRLHELQDFTRRFPAARGEYRERARFTADAARLDACAELLWLDSTDIFADREFVILQRIDPAPNDAD